MSDKFFPKIPFRGAVFGLHTKYGVQLVHGPTDAMDCGLYIHADDIEKYQAFEKAHVDATVDAEDVARSREEPHPGDEQLDLFTHSGVPYE